MEPLRDLGLVDVAVRSGLGALLCKYLQNCQVRRAGHQQCCCTWQAAMSTQLTMLLAYS